jgi:hypothetical protein
MNRALRARTNAALFLAAGVVTLGSTVAAGPASAGRIDAPQDPPGHNGDIKITAVDDDSEPPENNPMQGCTLSVEWYNFDEGDLMSHLTFEAMAPTADAELQIEGLLDVQVGEDAAGGGTDRDAREDYTFTTVGEPGPQGFHVKLDVHTPGVKGPGQKTKVFWIGDCSVEVPPTEPPPEQPKPEKPPVVEPPVVEPPVDEPPVDEPVVGEPVVVDPPADPQSEPQTDPADPAEVPLVVDAGAQASASGQSPSSSPAPGLAMIGALLALGGYLVMRSPKSGGAHRR